MSLSTLRCLLLFAVSTSVFLRTFLFLSLPSLSRASLSRPFHPFCSASGPFVHLFPFQPVSFVVLLARLLFSLSFLLPLPPPVVLFFHLFLFTPFPSHPRPVARSAGIRGIFEPVHDGRLLQGRTFLQSGSEIFGTKGLNPRN